MVKVCGPLPKTLTLFMAKICDSLCLIYDLLKNLTLYMTVAADTIALNIILKGILFMVFTIIVKK